jgi:arylsulfatase A-like enzyme
MQINKRSIFFVNYIVITLIFLSNKNIFAQNPNIMFIITDDFGWADLLIYGNKFNESHHLEQLAREDVTNRNGYVAMIKNLDNSVGRIVDNLEKAGLTESTFVFFYSDNNGLIGRYDQVPLLAESKMDIYKENPLNYIASSNAPLRGEKGRLFEGGIREPLIIKCPGKVSPGALSKAIVSSVDFYSTILDEVGASNPFGQILDGKSLLPELMEVKFDTERAVFWHYPVYHHSEPAGAIGKGDWKLIENEVTGTAELYKLKVDISEAMDLSLLYPDKTEELMSLLNAWQKDVGAEFPLSNPDFDIKNGMNGGCISRYNRIQMTNKAGKPNR